ncbi:MAG: 5-formyltetrahydrofolate cyclo-ligase [Deltaproteobacteria bacterium]|nr:5-formyltetrahydrofolate cyclo-ligase [Deltaproteobacteria bacterium]
MTKEQLRSAFLERRQSLRPQQAQKASNLIQKSAYELLKEIHPDVIALYHPFRGEVATERLFKLPKKAHIKIVYPRRIENSKILKFFQVDSLQELERRKSLFEPKADKRREVSTDHIDLFFLPGLAFDVQGYRLGYGHGHYDHTLIGMERHRLIGLAYAFQVVSSLPWAHHDVNVGRIVTESERIDCW